MVGGVFGTAALVAGIVALVTGSEVFLAVLVGSVVVLCLATTAGHRFGWTDTLYGSTTPQVAMEARIP